MKLKNEQFYERQEERAKVLRELIAAYERMFDSPPALDDELGIARGLSMVLDDLRERLRATEQSVRDVSAGRRSV